MEIQNAHHVFFPQSILRYNHDFGLATCAVRATSKALMVNKLIVDETAEKNNLGHMQKFVAMMRADNYIAAR